jgi:hypothetical protein
VLISVEEAGKNQLEPGQERRGYFRVDALLFGKKYLTKSDGLAGAAS